MPANADGPATPAFRSIPLPGALALDNLAHKSALAEETRAALADAPRGEMVSWGIPFAVSGAHLVASQPIIVDLGDLTTQWLVFMHTAQPLRLEPDYGGIISPMHGEGHLNRHLADYVITYSDGACVRIPLRARHQIGAYRRRWGENCFQAVAHCKPHPTRPHHEQIARNWGQSQTRVDVADSGPWTNWLYAWENPRPGEPIVALTLEPADGVVLFFGLAAGNASQNPLRWEPRSKAIFSLLEDATLDPTVSPEGLYSQVQIDMGTVISAQQQPQYPRNWDGSYNNQIAPPDESRLLIEYTAHPDARFHLPDGRTIAVADVRDSQSGNLVGIPSANKRVTLRVVERGSTVPVPVKLHVHGRSGEYLAPLDRHRQPNDAWFEDYAPEFVHQGRHITTYIDGITRIDLPLGTVYVEVSKGFEIAPVRRTLEIGPDSDEITIEIERALPWRERGWVTADTHVHFLSPMTALLEGSAEGVNVVNLLASQWGELMTNVGDFDGRNTWGSPENGGDGEYLVRVGTENRQHVLGHISLLGYRDRPILPMTTGGPDESAIGDPIDVLLTEWARQCHRQGGLVVLPHFPDPRAEHAAAIIEGDIDAIEMTSWGSLYGGIDPYSLSDWYRYLNCGYLVPCVGGTDKMSANTAVGTVRTYAHLRPDEAFSYDAWMDAVRRAETFVTYGPLIAFSVEGNPMGSRLPMPASGGTVDVEYQVATATVPCSRVELVANGEIIRSEALMPDGGVGHWSVNLESSTWLALLVRGHYADQLEIVAAHSSPVMVSVGKKPIYRSLDAVTILDQVEGALAYLDTIGTRKDAPTYRRMRLVLQAAHRRIHNQLHQRGYYHEHTVQEDHPEHH